MHTNTGDLVTVDEDSTGGYSHNLQVSPDQKFSVAVGYDRVMSFDLTDPSNPVKHPTVLPYTMWSVLRGSISPDSKFYYTRADDGLRTFSVDQTTFELSEVASIALAGEDVREVHVSPDGKFLYSKSRNQAKVYARDTVTGLLTAEPSKTIDFGGRDAVSNDDISSISPDGQKFAIGMYGAAKLVIYNIDQTTGELSSAGEIPRTPGIGTFYTAMSFSDDSAYLYTSQTSRSTIYVYKVADFTEVQAIKLPGVLQNHTTLITVSRGFNILYAAPRNSGEKDDKKIWKFSMSESDGTITYESISALSDDGIGDLAVLGENKILSVSITPPMSSVPASAVNIYIGTDSFKADAAEIGAKPLSALPDFSEIQYTVTHTSTGSDLVGLLDSLRIAVSKADFDDFAEDQGADRIDQVRTYQTAAGRCFDMNELADLGSQAAVLSGSFNASVGADPIVVDDGSADGISIPMDITARADQKVAAALPKALGAQMPLTNGKDEVLRIMVDESDFSKLAAFSVKGVGATDRGGNAGVTLQSLLHSVVGAEGDSIVFSEVNADHAKVMKERKVGHEIISALFRAYPAGHDNTNQVADTVWEHAADDFLELKKLPETINLQFVLKTELDLKDGGVKVLSTTRSPAAGGDFDVDPTTPDASRVLILYNFVFTA